jgi:putative FmdB family regulatory protein
MPVYEYRCNECGREFEYQQRMSDPEKTTCEACGKEALERLISRTAFALKGSGWYKDLYASAKPDKPAGDGGSSGDKPAADKPAAASSDSASSTPSPAASGGEKSSSSATGGGSSGGGSSGGSSSGGSSSGGSSSGGSSSGGSSSGGTTKPPAGGS